MAEFTPGPWNLKMWDEAQTLVRGPEHDGGKMELIATVSVGRNRPRGDANAHLIAAAPDLFAALESLLSFNGHYDGCFGGPPYNRICVPVCTQARAALRLARGEAGR